jgi:hypothetical protein
MKVMVLCKATSVEHVKFALVYVRVPMGNDLKFCEDFLPVLTGAWHTGGMYVCLFNESFDLFPHRVTGGFPYLMDCSVNIKVQYMECIEPLLIALVLCLLVVPH